MSKLNIAVVYGGFSPEFEISVKSGKYISSIIDKDKFNVYEILISRESWKEVNLGIEISKSDFSLEINNKKINFDAIINVIHGTPGEDGLLPAYWQLLNIAYVGCSAQVSSLTFNKYYCNNYLRSFGIVNIADSIILRNGNFFKPGIDKFIEQVGLPVFIKPSAGGSSLGTNKVKYKKDIDNFVRNAFKEGDEIIIEKFISGREFTCGVYKLKGKVKALTPVEIISKREFFDYEAKYNSNLNQEIIPPDIDDKLKNKIKHTSEQIYELLNCTGLVRVDYILSEDKLYFLEINSIPGMTSESIVPKMLRYEQIDISKLYTNFIHEAIFSQK